MTDRLLEILGFLGTATVAIGYLPQIIHLAKERCSAGISLIAWWVWLVSSFLIFSHALQRLDYVFIVLQSVHIVAIILIVWLARRYQGMTCPFHAVSPGHSAESAAGVRTAS